MRARTVKFDSLSNDDLGIIFESVTITAPEPRRIAYDIPYRNGVLDMSDYLGNIKYKNRTLNMSFKIPQFADHMLVYSNVLNRLHGLTKAITLSADEESVYEGMVIVGALSHDGKRWGFPITCDVAPYKNKITETFNSITGTGVIELSNSSKPVSPTVVATAETTLRYNDSKILNLIVYPYYRPNVYTHNGVTFTTNPIDGSVNVNGTATAGAYINLRARTSDPLYLSTGVYTCCGHPNKVVDGCYIYINGYNADGSERKFKGDRSGTGVQININEDELLYDESHGLGILIYVESGVTVENVTFYPMIEAGSMVSDYIKTTSVRSKIIGVGEWFLSDLIIGDGGKQILVDGTGITTFRYIEGEL